MLFKIKQDNENLIKIFNASRLQMRVFNELVYTKTYVKKLRLGKICVGGGSVALIAADTCYEVLYVPLIVSMFLPKSLVNICPDSRL